MGRIRSLDRYKECHTENGILLKFYKGRILKPFKQNQYGHIAVQLGKSKKHIHQLVMKTFVGQPKQGQEVRHINGVPTDNRLENLEYGTHSENIRDTYMQGQAWKKLTLTEVSAIKDLLKMGKTPKELAEIYGVSDRTIYHIKKGERHNWI